LESKRGGRAMRVVLLFVLTLGFALYAADQLCFDGQYGAQIWQRGNEVGAGWQRDAKDWARAHGYR
jgi:hypothetical protein